MIELLGITAIPLFLCSFLGFAVIFCQAGFLLKKFAILRKLAKHAELKAEFRSGEDLQNRNHGENHAGFEKCGGRFRFKKGRRLPAEGFLEFLASFTPTLGLFGTVLGIISVFKSIKNTTAAVTPALISAGLYEALFTTAFGLGLALIFLFWLNCARGVNNLLRAYEGRNFLLKR